MDGLGSDLDLTGECELVSKFQKPLLECIHEAPLEKHRGILVEWIQVRGPVVQPDEANGHAESVSIIWNLIQEVKCADEDFKKAQSAYDSSSQTISKVRALQIEKFGDNTDKANHVESWASEKMKDLNQHLWKQKDHLSQVQFKLDDACKSLALKLDNCGAEPSDPECDALMAEVEAVLGNLEIDDGKAPTSKNANLGESDPTPRGDDGIMDAQSLAMHHIEALPEGPQKVALMAVLQTAMVQKVR